MLNMVEMQVHRALLSETPEEIYARVYRVLKPRGRPPAIEVSFCRFANANSFIRMRDGRITARITDLLEGAPAPVMEALAFILLARLLRRPVPAAYNTRYRRYLNRRDVRRSLRLLRQTRGRKLFAGPEGERYNLEVLYEELNRRFFNGLMARPALGWSRRPSRTTLGHYDPAHNAIVISRILDRPGVGRLAVEYVLFHEMLHQRFPAEHNGARRRIHTREFQEAEKRFPDLSEAKKALKRL